MDGVEVLVMNWEWLTLRKSQDSNAYWTTDVVFSFIFSTRKRMSVVVRTPEGKIKLYCKGAVSTRNNFGPLSFEDRCVAVWPFLSTWPLRLCQSNFAASRQSALKDSLVSQGLVFNVLSTGYRYLWAATRQTDVHGQYCRALGRFCQRRYVNIDWVPFSLNLSSIFINQSKVRVHAERSHVSWRKEVLCYLATAGSDNFLRQPQGARVFRAKPVAAAKCRYRFPPSQKLGRLLKMSGRFVRQLYIENQI